MALNHASSVLRESLLPLSHASAGTCFRRRSTFCETLRVPAVRSSNASRKRIFSVRAETVRDGGSESEDEPSRDARISRMVSGMEGSFEALCDEFECVGSPAVGATARQLAKDLLELREEKRTLSCYATGFKYKDPLYSFQGKEAFKRPSWIRTAVEKPRASILEMSMKSTSVLLIRWKLTGRLRVLPVVGEGDLCVFVLSTFVLNQISGQVMEQRDEWDLSSNPANSTVLFLASRAAHGLAQKMKDASALVEKGGKVLTGAKPEESGFIFSDPSDPRRFFQTGDPNRDLYQIGLFLALVYFVVQLLRLTL